MEASINLPEFIFNEFVEVEDAKAPSIIKDEGFRKSNVTASGEQRADLFQVQRRRDRRGSDSSAPRTSPTSTGEILGDNEDYDDEVFISSSCESSATVISKKKATAKPNLKPANDSAPQNKEADFYTDECAVLTKRGEIKSLDALKVKGMLRVKTSDHTGCKLLSKGNDSSKSTNSSSSSAYTSAESLPPTNEANSGSSSLGYDEFGCLADILDYKNHYSNKLKSLPNAIKDDILSQCRAEDYPLEYESAFRRQVIPEDDARTRAITESNSRKKKESGEINSETFAIAPDSQAIDGSKASPEKLKKSSSVSYPKEQRRSSSTSSQEEFRIEKVVCDWVVPLSKKEKAEKRQSQVETFKSNTKNIFNLDRKKFVPSGLADYNDKKEYYSKFGTQDDEIARILFRDEIKSTKRKAKQVTKELKSVVRCLRLSNSRNPPKTLSEMSVSQSHSHPFVGKLYSTTLKLKSSVSFTVSHIESSIRSTPAKEEQDPILPIAPHKIREEIAVSSLPKSKRSPHIHSQGSKESSISESSSVATLVSGSASCLVDSSKKSYSASELEKEAVANSPKDMNLSLPDIEEMLKSADISFSSLASAHCSKVKGLDLSRFTKDLIQRDAENPPEIFAFLPSVDTCKENLGHSDKASSDRDDVRVTSPLKIVAQEAPKPTPVQSSPQPPPLISAKRPSPPFSKQLINRILASLPMTQPVKRKQSSQGSAPAIIVTPPSPSPRPEGTTQSQPQAKKDSEQTLRSSKAKRDSEQTLGSSDSFAASALGLPFPAEKYSQQSLQSNFTFSSDSLSQMVHGTHSSVTTSESDRKFHFRHMATSVPTPPSVHEVTTQTSLFEEMISIAIVPPTPPSGEAMSISSINSEKSDSSHLTVPPVDLSECAPPTLTTPGSPLESTPDRISPRVQNQKITSSPRLTVPPADTEEGVTPTFWTPGSPPPTKKRPFTHPPTQYDGSRMEFTFPLTNLVQGALPTVIVTPPTPPPPFQRRSEPRFLCPLPVLVELEERNTTLEDAITHPSHETEDDDEENVATISVGCVTPPSIFKEDVSSSNSDADNVAMPSQDVSESGKTAQPSSPCEDNKQVSRLSLSSVDLRSLKSTLFPSLHSLTNVTSPSPHILTRWEHGIIPAIVMTPPTPPNAIKAPHAKEDQFSGEGCLKICTSDGKVANEDAQFLSKLHTPTQATPDLSGTKVDTCLALATIPTPSPTDSLKGDSPNLEIFKNAPNGHIANVNTNCYANNCARRKNSSQSAPFLKGLYSLPSLEVAYQASLEDFEVDSLDSPLVSSPRMRKVGPSPLVTHSARSPMTKNDSISSQHIIASKSTTSSIASPSMESPFKPPPHPVLSKPTPAHYALSPHWDTDAMPAKLGTPHVSSPCQVFHFEPAPEGSAHVHSASVPSLSADNPTPCPIIILNNERADSTSEEGEYSFYVPFKPLLNFPESPNLGSIDSSASSSSSSSSNYSNSFHSGSRAGSSLGTLGSHTPRGEKQRRSSMSTGKSTSRKSVQFALSTKPGSDCSVCKENSASSSLTPFEDLISPSSAGSSFSQNYNYRNFACSSDEICSTTAEKSPSFSVNDRDYKLAKRLQAYELLSSSAESIQSSENSIDPAVLSEVVHFTSPGTMKRPVAPTSVRIEFQDSVPSLRSSLFAGKRKNDENGEFNRAVMMQSQANHSPKAGSTSPNVMCAQSSSCGSTGGETDLSSICDIVHMTNSSANSDDENQYLDLNSYRSGNDPINSSVEAASVESYFLQGQDLTYDSVHSTKADTIASEGTSMGPSVESYLRPLETQFAAANKSESTISRSAPSVLSFSQSKSTLPENGSSSIEKIGDIILKFSNCEKATSAPSIRSLISPMQHQPSKRHRSSVYFRPSVKLENAIATAVDLKHGLEATIAILSSTNRRKTPRRRFSITAIDSPLVCRPPPPTPVSSEKSLILPKITINEKELQEYKDIDNAHKKYLKMLSTATPLMQRILTTSGWPAVAFLLEEPIEPYSVEPPEWFQAIQRQGDHSPPQVCTPTKAKRASVSNEVIKETETNLADIRTPEQTKSDVSKSLLVATLEETACNLEDTPKQTNNDASKSSLVAETACNLEDTPEQTGNDALKSPLAAEPAETVGKLEHTGESNFEDAGVKDDVDPYESDVNVRTSSAVTEASRFKTPTDTANDDSMASSPIATAAEKTKTSSETSLKIPETSEGVKSFSDIANEGPGSVASMSVGSEVKIQFMEVAEASLDTLSATKAAKTFENELKIPTSEVSAIEAGSKFRSDIANEGNDPVESNVLELEKTPLPSMATGVIERPTSSMGQPAQNPHTNSSDFCGTVDKPHENLYPSFPAAGPEIGGPVAGHGDYQYPTNSYQPEQQAAYLQHPNEFFAPEVNTRERPVYASTGAYTEWVGYPCTYPPDGQAMYSPVQGYQPTAQGAPSPTPTPTESENENVYSHGFYDAGGHPPTYQAAPYSQSQDERNVGHGVHSTAGYQPTYQTGQMPHQAQDEHGFYNTTMNQPTYQPTGEARNDENREFFNSNAANNAQFQSMYHTQPKSQDDSVGLCAVGYQPTSHTVTRSQHDDFDGCRFHNVVEYQSAQSAPKRQNKNADCKDLYNAVDYQSGHQEAPNKNADCKDLCNAVGYTAPKSEAKNVDSKDLYNAVGCQSTHSKYQNKNGDNKTAVGFQSTAKYQNRNADSKDWYNTVVGNGLTNQTVLRTQGQTGMSGTGRQNNAPLVDYEDFSSSVSDSSAVEHKKPATSPKKQRGVLSPPPVKKIKTRKYLSQRAKYTRSRLVDYSDTSMSTQSAVSKPDIGHSRGKPNAKKNRGKSALEILSTEYARSSDGEMRVPLVSDYCSGSQASSEQELVQQSSVASDKKLNDTRANSQEEVRAYCSTELLKEESSFGSCASVKSYLATNNTSYTQLLSDSDLFENPSESMAEIISVTDNFLSYMSSLNMTSSDDGGAKPQNEDAVTESEQAEFSSNPESETTFNSHETHSSYFSSGLCRVSRSIPTSKPRSNNILPCQAARETTVEARGPDECGLQELNNITSSESKETVEIQVPIKNKEELSLEESDKQKPKLNLVVEEDEKVQEVLPPFEVKEKRPHKQAPTEIEGVDESKPLQLKLITPPKKDGISSKRHYVIPPNLKLPPFESETLQKKETPEQKKEALNPRASLMPQLSTVAEVVEGEVKSADGASTPASFFSEDCSVSVSLGSPSNVSPKKQQKKKKHRIRRFFNTLF